MFYFFFLLIPFTKYETWDQLFAHEKVLDRRKSPTETVSESIDTLLLGQYEEDTAISNIC